MLTTILIIGAIVLAIAAFVGVGCIWAVKLGEDDLPEPGAFGYPDQDGERTPARHQWVNAGAKVHHADPLPRTPGGNRWTISGFGPVILPPKKKD